MPDREQPDYRAAGTWQRLADAHRRLPVHVDTHCGDVACEPDWSWRTTLTDHDLWSVVRGRGEVDIISDAGTGDGPTTLTPGTTLALRPGDRVRARQDPRDRLRVLFIHHDFAAPGTDDTVPADVLLPRVVQLTDRAPVQARMRSIVHWVHREGTAGRARADLELLTVLLDCHRQVARASGALPPPMDPRISQVVDLVRGQPGDRLRLTDAAVRARLSPGVFSRLFTAETGESFRSFCVRVRLERARDLLTNTALSVTEVSRALGYRDHRLFVRQFSAATGVPPGAWRSGDAPAATGADQPRRAPTDRL